jgi:Glycosyl transferases group 1
LDDKIFVLRACPQEGFLPLSWEEKEAIKQGFAGGKEYFLVRFQAPDSKDLVFILKAFSQFKKRQHSNVQLLITLMDTGGNKEFNHKLETYKYRKEVHLVAKPDRTTLAKIMAGAYAFIQPGDQEQDIINAFKAETPVIRLSADRNPGIYEGALLLAATGEQDQLTEQLKRLYKDESLRAELVAKAKQIAASRSWQDLVASLWNGLSRSMGSKKE